MKNIARNKVENFDDLMCLKDNFSLKEIPNIRGIISDGDQGQRRKSKVDEVSFLKIDDLVSYLKIPIADRTRDNHRIIFLALSGLRFQSSLDLKTNSTFVKKICSKCHVFEVCPQPTSTCFNRIISTIHALIIFVVH